MIIFKAHDMPINTIFQILGNVEKDIRQSYTGGAVDSYIPHNGENKNLYAENRHTLYYYDMNSMYPHVMSSMPLTVGKPIAFDGDIRSVDPNSYGFFTVKSQVLFI